MKLTELLEGKTPDPHAAAFVPERAERAMELVRSRPEPRAGTCDNGSGYKAMKPFLDVALEDVANLTRHDRPVGIGAIARDLHAVKDAADQHTPGRWVRGALIQLAATCVMWAAKIERNADTVGARDLAA